MIFFMVSLLFVMIYGKAVVFYLICRIYSEKVTDLVREVLKKPLLHFVSAKEAF